MAITFPVGFVFRPTDKEVIQHYLLKKQIEEELPLNGVIQERDVYSEEVLSEVFRSSETHVYFFTQLKKKYFKGSNHDRTVGKATWRSESVDDIRLDENTIIGKKRVLDYINPGSVDHGDWNMKEFSLDGVLLEIPQTSSDYVVCLLEKKEQAIKRDRQKNMQSKKRTRGALENLPSGCFNYKRIKLPSKQNQQTENQQTESAPLVDEQVGLINGEAGVETLKQIMQYLLEPDSSMVDVDEENVEQMMQYLLQPDSPLDSMPPLIEAKPAPTVDEDGGYPSGENESSDYYVCLLEKKERAIKRDGKKNMQSKKNAPVNTLSGCFNNKRVKISSNQNQQMENQQTESASLVDEQVGLINGEAGVETLEQIMQYLLEPDSSMVDVDVENVERMMQYLLEPDSPLDSMPPLMEAKPAPTVDEDSGYPSGENEVRMQPSIPDQSLPSSNPEYAVLDYIHSLASGPEVTAIENDVRILEQPSTNKRRRLLLVTSIPPPESLLADSPGHAILNSVIPSATSAPTVEPSYEVAVPQENEEQEIGMLPVEKSHWDYQPSIAAPESLTDDAIRNSIILLSTTVEGFAEDFIDPFLNGN